jgi:hypothetical protein
MGCHDGAMPRDREPGMQTRCRAAERRRTDQRHHHARLQIGQEVRLNVEQVR